jgi:hypothetical protein
MISHYYANLLLCPQLQCHSCGCCRCLVAYIQHAAHSCVTGCSINWQWLVSCVVICCQRIIQVEGNAWLCFNLPWCLVTVHSNALVLCQLNALQGAHETNLACLFQEVVLMYLLWVVQLTQHYKALLCVYRIGHGTLQRNAALPFT